MAVSRDYQTYLIDLFGQFGPITARRMFGALGLYAGEVMFGLVADEIIYLKTAERDRKAYEEEGSKPFSFHLKSRANEVVLTSYYSLPERLYDEPEELAAWARRAYDVAAASPHSQKKRQKRAKERSTRQPARRRSRS